MPTNLLPSNQQNLSTGLNTGWFTSHASVTTGQVDPLGGTAAVQLIDTTSNTQHTYQDAPFVSVAAADYTVQIYAKAGVLTQTKISALTTSGGGQQIFDLSNGSLVGGLNTYGTGVTALSASIGTDANATGAGGNGWYLLTLSVALTNASAGLGMAMLLVKGGVDSYAGTGSEGTYFSTPVMFLGAINYASAVFAGAGGATTNLTTEIDTRGTASFVGAGGWTAAPYQFYLVPVEAPVFHGVGGWIPAGSQSLDQTGAVWGGAGGWQASSQQIDQTGVSWHGAGGWLINTYQFNLSPVEVPILHGAGGWTINPYQFDLSPVEAPTWPGLGGWSASPYQFDLSPVEAPTWPGLGGWNAVIYQFNLSPIEAPTFNGAGGWSISPYQFNLSPIEAPTFNGAGGWTFTADGTPATAVNMAGAGGAAITLANAAGIASQFNGVGGWRLPFLSTFSSSDTDYSAEDGTTLYVTENGLNNYTTEFTVVTGQLYVTEDTLSDYVTEDGLSVYVPENYQPTLQAITVNFNGQGGWFLGNFFEAGTRIYANFNGAGGWSLPYLIELGKPPVFATWNGTGNLTVKLASSDTISLAFNGVGGWHGNFISVQLPAFPIFTEFDGVGGWFINPLSAHVETPLEQITWNGIGGWAIDVVETQLFQPIFAEFDGVGGWLADVGIVLSPGGNPPIFLLLDPVWRRLYSEPLTVGTPITLLLNVGVPVTNPVLTITRPDGTSYQTPQDFVLVGKVDFPSETYFGIMPYPSFRAHQYVYYAVRGGEFNQAGTWTVTLQSSAGGATMSFMVNNLNALALAA